MTFPKVYNGATWCLFCRLADQARARRIPRAGLVPYGPSPLSSEACLDPGVVVDPGRIYPAPARVRPDVWETIDEAAGVEVEALSFSSAAPFGIARNDRVVVRFYRPAGRRPLWSLLVLHGVWRQGTAFEDHLCRDLARRGVSCALLSLPFHWERALARAPSGAYFLSSDPLWTSAAFRQGIVDARAVLDIIRGRGVPVGVIGFSLGGILAHILMALEPVDLGVSVIAGGNTAGIVWESILTRPYRRAMESRGITLAQLSALWAPGNPTVYAARGRPPRLVMLNARYDLLVPLRFTEELWRALGEPPIRWLPAGHVTAFLFREVIVGQVLRAMGLPVPAPTPRRFRLTPAMARPEAGWAA